MNFRPRLGNRKFSARHARVFRLSPSLPFAALTLTTANKSLLPSSPPLPAGPASALSLLLSSPSSAQGQCRVLSEGLKELARYAVEPRFSCFFLSLVHCRRRQQATSRTTNKASNFFVFQGLLLAHHVPVSHRPPPLRTQARDAQCATDTRREGEIEGTSVRQNDLFSRWWQPLALSAHLLACCSLSRSLEYSLKNQQVPWSLL